MRRFIRRCFVILVKGTLVLAMLCVVLGAGLWIVQQIDFARRTRWAEREPTNATVQLAVAQHFEECYEYERAIAVCRRWAERVPDDPTPFRELGRLYGLLDSHAEAVAAYERALALEPDDPAAYVSLAAAYADAHRSDDARATYETAVGRWPGHADAWFGLAKLLCKAGEGPAAVDAFRQSVALVGPGVGQFSDMGNCLLFEDLDTDGYTVYQDAVALFPDDLSAHIALAEALRQRNEPLPQAALVYRQATQLRPNDVTLQLKLAQTLLWGDEPAQALDVYREILQRDPQSVDARLGAAEAYANMGDAGAALRVLDPLLTEMPSDGFHSVGTYYSPAGMYWWKSQLLSVVGREDEAQRVRGHAERQEWRDLMRDMASRSDSWRWEALGHEFAAAGKHLRAGWCYRIAIYFRSNPTRPRLALAESLEARGHHDKAASARRQAIEEAQAHVLARPDSSYPYLNLILALLATGAEAEAAATAETATQMDPDFGFGYLLGAQALYRQGRYTEARMYCRHALDLFRAVPQDRKWRWDVPAYYLLAKSMAEQGDLAAAEEAYARMWRILEYTRCTGNYRFDMPGRQFVGIPEELIAEIQQRFEGTVASESNAALSAAKTRDRTNRG